MGFFDFFKQANINQGIEEYKMINILIEEIDNNIEIYNEGVLIIKETSYNKVVLIVKKLKEYIQDAYQLEVLNEILRIIELSEVA